MKLHWSPKSPFVRKVMVVAHETGTVSQLQLVRSVAAMTKVNPDILVDNPLGKIPTLVLDDGRAIYDSLVISQYLDALSDQPTLFPIDGEERWDALTRHALAQGLMEALIVWRNELNREAAQQLAPLLIALNAKVTATLDVLERDAPRLGRVAFDIGQASLGCALSYMDFRFAEISWRQDRPALAAWQAAFDARPSAIATAIIDD